MSDPKKKNYEKTFPWNLFFGAGISDLDVDWIRAVYFDIKGRKDFI